MNDFKIAAEVAENFSGGAIFDEVRDGANVESSRSVSRDDIRSGSSFDHAEIEGRGAEGGMGALRDTFEKCSVEFAEGVHHFEDGVFSEVRLGSMGGLTRGFDGGPKATFGAVDCFERSWLTDDRELIFRGVMLRKMSGTRLAGFLAHEADEIDGDGEFGEDLMIFFEPPEHGGHGAFCVGSTATVNFPIANFGAEGIDGHSGDAHGIEMRPEKDTRAVVGAGSAGDEIGAARFGFFENDIETQWFEEG